ncbi:MAG: hypothetical protein JEZ06_06990 [Anaerolineaceae bacterium]|nr:hypothetical protein [Anaerolineaceae bacterium]
MPNLFYKSKKSFVFSENNLLIPNYIVYIMTGLFAVLLILLAWLLMPDFIGDDWAEVFYPAACALLEGKDPYAVNQFMIAPWVFPLFIPLSWLPVSLAMAILRVLGLFTYSFVAFRMGVKPIGLIAILLSPQIMHNIINCNIDWLAFLGFILPPQIGLFLVIIKPQIGCALMIYWAYDTYQQKRMVRTFAPFIIVLILSFMVFGLWPLHFSSVQEAYNASAWPISLPFGIVLLLKALKEKEIRIAQGISPLFSPHVMFHSWATMLYALIPNTFELILAVAASWVLVVISIIY